MLFAPQSHQAIMAGMEATWWLNDQLEVWLGEKNAADTLAQSVPHNVTSEMGLALLDVADVIRPHPEVVAFLRDLDVDADDKGFLDELAQLPGGPEAAVAIRAYLDTYGMRCVGEIDITRPRWAERPDDARARHPRQHRQLRAGRRGTALRTRAPGGGGEGTGAAGAPAGPSRRRVEGRGDEADDRPSPDVHGVPGVPEVRHGQPLPRLQAGPAGGSRAPRRGRRAP